MIFIYYLTIYYLLFIIYYLTIYHLPFFYL